jgi:PKD repeat protein
MKTKLLVLIAFVLCWTNGSAKNLANHQIQKKTFSGVIKDPSDHNVSSKLFKILPNSSEIDVSKDIKNAVFLELDFAELTRIKETKPSLLTLKMPISANEQVAFDLHDVRILADKFSIVTGNNEKVNYTPGLYYQGGVFGISPSLAAWSMFDNSIMAVFSYNNENWVLGLWKDKSNVNNNIYILYKDRDVQYAREFKCGTKETGEAKNLNGNNHVQSNQCIKVYFECDYQMYLDNGNSVTNVTNFVTGMFNVVQALYNVEVLNVEISQIYVWSASDPYIPFTTSTDLLNNFQSTRTTFNGNVAHLLTTRNLSAGGLAYLDVICNPSNGYGISNIDNNYLPYPNYCWTSEVVTHELGHNFGSNHTHWCGWPGGAIDDCYTTEGGCAPGPHPTNEGTIMSYCHLSSTGILLTNGFGPLPGGAIRASYAAASCLTACASAPSAEFSATPLSSCTAPLTVVFTDHTIGAVTSWAWDIDNDGTTDYTTESPSHTYTSNGTYTVRLIATNANGSDTIIKTNYVSVGNVTPSVSTAITAGASTICAGTTVTFTATPTNGGATPSYQWYLNGTLISGQTSIAYSSATLANNDIITCKITSNAPCASPTTATSAGTTMTVNPSVAPAVSVLGSAIVCTGASVTYTAISTNGGSIPAYQWKLNGTNAGTNSPIFTPSSIANGDIVTCVLTSNALCTNPTTATSTAITVTVDSIVTPAVSIAVTSGTNPTCANVPITFTATSVNGGTSPVYQWKKNGVNASTGATFTPTSLTGGDVISCVLTSNRSCLSVSIATSAGVTISLISGPSPTVLVAITSGTNPSCAGAPLTFTATAANGGTAPTYQWYLNGSIISGAQSQTYTPSTLIDGTTFLCELTSNTACPETVSSIGTTVTLAAVATINFISDINVCAGTIPSTVFTSNPPGANYTWTNTNTSIGLNASGTGNVPSFITTNTSSSSITSTVTVTPSISSCPGTPSSYTITVDPTPAITQNGATLTSSSGTTYQWYFNGQPIVGATSQTYIAKQNGNYSVIVDNGACASAVVNVTNAGISESNNDYSFTVYPNPNNGNFFVSFTVPEKNTYTLKVIDVLGAILYKEQLTNFNGEYSKQMNLSGFAKGIYLISLSKPDNEIVKKIIIY